MGEGNSSPSSSLASSPSSSTPRPAISYSRGALLALYKSPLVPSKLHGMKELADWYGEYNDLPSSPAPRARDMHGGTPSRTNSSNNGTGITVGGRPNPFANFGRFGVDGGLEGEAIGGKLGAGGEKRRGGGGGERDAAPHMGGSRDVGGRNSRVNGGERDGEVSSPRKEGPNFFSNERERSDRMRTTRGDGAGVGAGRERRDENVKRDRRAPDEGGWRSVGGTGDRDRRLGRGNSSNNVNDSRDTRGDNRRDRDRDGEPRRSRQPAWMDDEPSSTSRNEPAWMDAPASGNMSFGSGNVIEKERASSGALNGLSGAGADGVDSIQAWKKQMKEMERREREKEQGITSAEVGDSTPHEQPTVNGNSALPPPPEPTSSSVLSSLLGAGGDPAMLVAKESKPSVFGDLLSSPSIAPAGVPSTAGGGGGGRGSRFAKFFDGKPPAGQQMASPTPQPQQQPSVFESLMGVSAGSTKNAGSPGPSKEDADSMARLLGMLQVSSARASSPGTAKKAQPSAPSPQVAAAAAPSPLLSPAPTSASNSSDNRRGGGGSRFAFSQNAPQQGPPPQQQQPLQSPPLQSHGAPQQSFGFPPQQQQSTAPSSSDSRGPSSIPPHSRVGSNTNTTSPPVGQGLSEGQQPAQGQAQGQGPPPQQQQQPQQQSPFMGPGGAQGTLPLHLQQQGSASRPLPPPSGGRPDYPQPQQQKGPNGMHLPMSMGPNGRPIPPPMFSPPIHPGDLPPHLRGLPHAQGGGPPLLSPGQYGRPPLPPGSAPPPPPFMMYGGPPPPPPHGMYGAPPPQFRGPPPPPMGYGGPGGVDLMALLNSGGGPRMGPPPPQQQARGPGPDMRQYMPLEEQRQ